MVDQAKRNVRMKPGIVGFRQFSLRGQRKVAGVFEWER
jgi:hypothetical protein